jgi:hypothetical protein
MSLDGLRAWIGEVERKLGVRTRIFLLLTAIAIGAAGAAIYLALDAGDKATGESDVSALEGRIDQLEAQQATAEPTTAPLEAQIEELRKQIQQLEGKGAGTSGAAGETGGVGATGGAEKVKPAPEEAKPLK